MEHDKQTLQRGLYFPQMHMNELSDEALVERGQSERGEHRRALTDELFRRYYERVGRWCFRLTGDRESAADLAQEVFVKAWRHLDTYTATAKFSTWLYTIMRNECLNAVKSRQRRASEGDFDMTLDIIDSGTIDPETAFANETLKRNLRSLLTKTLEDTERTVFTLHYAEDMPLEAITRLLSLTNASGAKAFIVSAKRKLTRAVERLHASGGALQ